MIIILVSNACNNITWIFSFDKSYIDHTFLFLLCSVLDCHPHLSEAKKLIQELNVTNGLYSFVRIMRTKFQEVAAGGTGLISRIPYFTLLVNIIQKILE